MEKMLLKATMLMTFLVFNILTVDGQSKIQSLSFKKGEVLDILLLSQNADTETDLKDYFKIAFPVAKKMSYESLPGFKVIDHTQGNLRPGILVLGKWNNLDKREAFLNQIEEEVPDFHERRRKIWHFFGLRYFEVKEDLSFDIERERYHVATAYWLESQNGPGAFSKKWEREMKKMGGKLLIKLSGGQSPFGYRYDPDVFVITSWESEVAFKSFHEQIQKLGLNNIQHINEFILE